MREHLANPHYPQVVWAFPYQGVHIEITISTLHHETVYSAWVNHAQGSAVAVPKAYSCEQAIARAKTWVDQHFSWG